LVGQEIRGKEREVVKGCSQVNIPGLGVFCKPVWMSLKEDCDSGWGVTGESNDLLTGTGGCCEPMRSL